ncbi:hypothetical protein ZWY2020_006220, partial [Hordeum vulgare]
MPSWNDGETSSDDDREAISMGMGLLEEPDIIVEPLFYGQLEISEPKCILHLMRPLKCVAFEGWVDKPWPTILQRCLSKLWEMFHDKKCGKVLDGENFEEQLAKLKDENVKICTKYNKLVEDVGKMFDWKDGRVDHMDSEKI